MRRIALLGLLAAASCQFDPRGQGGPGEDATVDPDGAQLVDATDPDAPPPPIDAAVIDAAMIDAAMIDARPPCTVESVATPSDASQVGSDGGSNRTALRCPGEGIVVGLRLRTSDQATDNGAVSTFAFELQCGELDLASGTVVRPGTVGDQGGGCCNWTPSHDSGAIMCPANHAVRWLEARTGSNDNVLANVKIGCSPITEVGGAPVIDASGPALVVLAIPNSGASTAGREEATCPSDRVMVGADYRSGAGIDAITPRCAVARCQP